MPGFANLFYLGQPDPAQQLAALLAGRQPQGAPSQGPAPPAATPAPTGGAAAAGPNAAPAPGDGSAPNPSPGDPPPPGSQPQPQALTPPPAMAQSYQALANPPNIMSLMVQMQQRQEAMAGINAGFAQIAANYSPPSMRNAIMQNANAGGGDAGTMVNNIMSLYGAQNQMAAQQQLLSQAPDIAAKLNMPEGIVRAQIMAGRGDELIRSLEPTDMAKNYAWAHKTYADAHPGASPDEIEQGAQGLLMGMGGMGGGDAATRSWRAAKIQWDQNPSTKGTAYPWGVGADDNPTSFVAWQTGQKQQEAEQTAAQGEAAKLGPQYRDNLQGARDRVAGIIGLKGYDQNGDPILDPARQAQLKNLLGTDMAQKFVNSDPTKQGTWDQDLASWWGGLGPSDQALLTQIRDATDEKTLLGGLKTRAPKRGSSDASDIGVNLGGMRNVTQPIDDWMPGALKTIKSIDTATMNSFGAQGTPEQAEQYARTHGLPNEAPTLMDDSYLSGGTMYPKGKAAGAMPQPQIDAATAAIKSAADPEAERQKQIKLALIRNTDPTPLKNLRL